MQKDLCRAMHFMCIVMVAFFILSTISIFLAQAQESGQSPAPSTQVKPKPTKDSPEWMDARLTKIHRKLRITSEQEGAWNDYAKGMRETAESMQPLYAKYYKEQHTMNAVENMRLFMEMSEAHAKVQKVLIPLFEKLYNMFSDKQKAIADEFFSDEPASSRHKK